MSELIILDVPFQFGPVVDVIHPVVLAYERGLALVDCGYTGALSALERAFAEKGLSCARLTHVVITHQDHDHMGGLFELKTKYPQIKVVAHRLEAPYVSGARKNLRLDQAERLQDLLPPERKAFGRAFLNVLEGVRPVPVDLEVEDGDRFDWGGGCQIVWTPGHTPGHISLNVEGMGTLIGGDAAALEDGKLVLANPQFMLNPEEAQRSLMRIAGMSAREIACYHGGVYRANAVDT